MKRLAAAALFATLAAPALADSYVEPVIEAPVVVADTTSSSSGGMAIVAMFAVLFLATAAAN